jgi:superfamily II DNA or RNA helicase
LFGVTRLRHRTDVLVDLAAETDGELDKTTFVKQAREQLRDPEDDSRYSESYLRRTVSTFVQLGLLRDDDGIGLWQFGRDYHTGDLDFETFLWYGLVRTWVIGGEFPEGIDGLRAIHRVLRRADGPLTSQQIRDRLATNHGYSFNEQGIRGYLPLFTGLGAIRETSDGYVTENTDRWTDRLRNVDLLPTFERWLRREGPKTEPPDETVKRDLAKYYLYRECGGHGQHRSLYDTFRKEYLADGLDERDPAVPRLRRDEQYIEVEEQRADLREKLTERVPNLDGRDLAGLSLDVLRDATDATDPAAVERTVEAAGPGLSRADVVQWGDSGRDPYTFPPEFELYDWQVEAADQWFDSDEENKRRGIASVVTGAGKTVMALSVVRQFLDQNPDAVVSVIVPTRVLMRQWLEEFSETLNIPTDEVGWAGGGHKDTFDDGTRVLVSIVNSAVSDNFLAEAVDARDPTDHLLVADECHRYTGDKFSDVFEVSRTASLGLSATPLSNPGSEERTESDDRLVAALGDVYYDLTYDEAIDRQLISEFQVDYVGFDLTDAERTTYERLSEQVTDAVTEIRRRHGNRLYELSGPFSRKLTAIAEQSDTPTPAISDFFQYTQDRRDLVADAVGRQAITLGLLRRGIEENSKSIVFQERIEQLERMVAPAEQRGRNNRTGELTDSTGRQQLYDQYPGLARVDDELESLFFDPDYRPVMYHSGHRSDAWNDFAVEWFDDNGFANTMLSVKALVEGVDVPSADVGIVRVSSGSVRQRIQTFGRVLRTGDDPTETSRLYVLYARDTVDEDIFGAYDWEEQLAGAEVAHKIWDPNGDWAAGEWDPQMPFERAVRPATPDERPEPETTDIPDGPFPDLKLGDEFPGRVDGYRFSVDSDGDPFESRDGGRQYINGSDVRRVARRVHERKGGGTVVVTEHGHAVATTKNGPIYVGDLDPTTFEYDEDTSSITDEPDDLEGML